VTVAEADSKPAPEAHSTPPPEAAPTPPPAHPPNHKRTRVLLALAAVFLVAGAAAAGWWWFDGRWYETTDDAYVNGNLVQLTPQIAGIVVRINADDTALVRAGDPVVLLDRADTQTALAQAQAALAQTVRSVRELYANTEALRATVAQRRAEWRRAQDDLERRTGLPDARAVAEEDLKHAQAQVDATAAAVRTAEQQLAASEAMVSRTTVATHPNVKQAAAKLREAYLAAQRASIVAPVTGYVAKRSVQVGQQVAPGASLLAIVPLTDVWVDANFKETQLQHVRIGQHVTLTADLYGGAVKYRGTVIGLAPGTGSAFALLPPQNATGNWIKIVQRLPVRIQLDAQELTAHPLRLGLSTNVAIDTHDRTGPVLAVAPPTQPAATTQAYEKVLAEAERLEREIIQANLGEGERIPSPSRRSSARRNQSAA
jgi:membrane fusion protein (multidrug efflux system)